MAPRRESKRDASIARRGLAGAGCLVGLAWIGCVASGCFFNDSGLPPPTNSFYYPTGLAVSPGRSTMYVANSDFDLQYNGGTVQAVDLTALRGVLAPMLAGIRCSEGVASECSGVFATWGASCGAKVPCAEGLTCSLTSGTCGILQDVCNQQPYNPSPMTSANANGVSCTLAADCFSGLCSNNVCAKCEQDSDCPSSADAATSANCPGKCTSDGVCQLTCVSNNYLTPAACSPFTPPYRTQGVATIGAFASGAVIALNPASTGTARLFVPVRGDPSITYFDIPDDSTATPTSPATKWLDCGQSPSAGDTNCVDSYRIGVDPYDNFRDETLPVEPVGLDVSDDGSYLVTAHSIPNGPAVGLTLNPWDGRPTFAFALTQNVAASPSNVAHIPEPKLVKVSEAQAAAGTLSQPVDYQQGFLMTYNAAAEIDTFSVNPDPLSSPPRPFLTRANSAPITVNQTGTDSRGLAVDATERVACESACDATQPVTVYDACLSNCLNTPLNVFIANRAPPSLLIGQIATAPPTTDDETVTSTGLADTLTIYANAAPLTQGPSNVAFGQVIAPDGSLQTMVFAVSFDTRRVNIYDLATQTLIYPPIATGRGPQAIAFDACSVAGLNGKFKCGAGEAPHAYLYVGHFTDSYLGVVDLDMSHPETFGTMFASVGVPIAPVETQ